MDRCNYCNEYHHDVIVCDGYIARMKTEEPVDKKEMIFNGALDKFLAAFIRDKAWEKVKLSSKVTSYCQNYDLGNNDILYFELSYVWQKKSVDQWADK